MKKEYYENKINNSPKLPDLFKELQDIRYGRSKAKVLDVEPKKEEIKFNKIYVMDHKFNIAGAIIGVLFITLFFSTIHSNSIYATTEKERIAISDFEENNNKLDMLEIVSKNINEVTQKEIVAEETDIEYEVTYIQNSQLPMGEEVVTQEGKPGKNKSTKIRTYENDRLVDEKVISVTLVDMPINRVIEVGTSEYLRDIGAHIGDKLYTKEDIILYSEPIDQDDKKRLIIYQYIDLTLKSVEDGWAKIVVDGISGYVKSDLITTDSVMPGIAEKSRIKRLCLGVSVDMPLNTPSGLTKEDFIKVLSNNPNDTNKIFEENAEFFYEIEQKYKINGIFVASVGIHESNWGRSAIANQKKNLFGYGSYDSDAYGSSYEFESYRYGIELVSKVFVKYYLNPAGTAIYDGETAVGSYYNGPTLKGVNIRYASDQEWANKVCNTMKNLYERLY